MIEAYPLQWPVAYARTPKADKIHGRFQTTFASARDAVIREIMLLGGKNAVISSNVPLKKDGRPYAVPFGSVNTVDDSAIAVYFELKGHQKVICCDAYITLDDNMQAIRKSVEALRGLERWKCSDIINQTFTGFKALPEKATGKSCWDILGISITHDCNAISKAYHERAKKLHPDAGGDADAFSELQAAYRDATSLIGM